MIAPVVGSSPPQKLSGSSSGRQAARGMPGRQCDAPTLDVHSRTTRPARAEATHSASEPKATPTPRLPGA